ncbi:vacuolar protein sorting-associated protein 8 homolog [Tubulanus polymorphus]|uniref:vacuolar protein sorting-associated protein 8 homolog n=1 Tax=Tubulanus polymorphus TaxID=672921 RepID=UPI003DA37089
MSSQEGILSDKPKKGSKNAAKYEKHGSIVRHVSLKGISRQLMSAADRVDAGMPTTMAVSTLIAIGTSHGLVLVFDPKQALKWCLGSTAVGAQYGSVSALSFNKDCTRLLCGFARGQITMWDITNGKLLRTITDAHPPGTAVLHIKFTDDLTIATCNDSGGSVFELEFKRLIGVRTCESRCLFSGSRGEVCVIEPLHMNYQIKDHPMKDVLVLAMGTLSKVLVVTLRPKLKVMFMHPLKGDPTTLPILAWQFVIIQVSDSDRVIDPVLAFGRDRTIYFYQVVCKSADDITFCCLQKMTLNYTLLAIEWMNTKTLITLDTSEKLHIIDVRTDEELAEIDVSYVQLGYASSIFKSLATGGNVSKALALAGERACYNSVVCNEGQFLLLGVKSVHVMTLRTWEERIDVLVKADRYQDALQLAYSFYDGSAKAVIGLLGGRTKRRSTVSAKMMDLLYNYVDLSMTTNLPERGKLEELEEYYQNVVPVCVDYCLSLGKMSVLFGRIYERFSMDQLAKGVFLECLEPFILNDKLISITPSVMKDFINHYEAKGMLQNVEACIVHLDIASLDIHQVVVLCWGHGLYDAIIYVYNKGMQDYVTALEELLHILCRAVVTGKQLTDDQIRLGNKLLVYISCCLAGRAYPLGDIPAELVSNVKEDVFRSITALHTKEPAADEEIYPYLRTLLRFDTREFLNVLALAFEEPEFNSEDGIRQRQRVVDILLQVMVESVGFSPTQVGILFTFLARQMARHENTIHVNRVLFEQVLEFLSNPDDESRHEERQQALMELLNVGQIQFDEDRLLLLAEKAQFYRVCEHLYEKRRQFDKILACYWSDASRKHQAFAYIEKIIISRNFTEDEKNDVKKEALKHLPELIQIDSKKAAELTIIGFANALSDIIKKLSDDSKMLYEFLKGVFEYKEANESAIYSDRQIIVEPGIHEFYIGLMCQHEPNTVYNYIMRADNYRIDETLAICQKYQLSEPTAFLLEKSGKIQPAFDIMLQTVHSKIQELTDILQVTKQQLNQEQTIAGCMKKIEIALFNIIHLSQRSSPRLDESGREALWFPLLDLMMTSQRKLKEEISKQFWEDFKGLTGQVLNSMMGFIALPAILQKIIQDPTYSSGKFGDIRELILGMLDTYNYEKTLLNTCNNLLNYDLHLQLASLHRAANRGFVPRGEFCSLCGKTFGIAVSAATIIVFRCGHSYHTQCLHGTESRHVINGEEHWACYLCSNTKEGRGLLAGTRLQWHMKKPESPKLLKTMKRNQAVMNEEQILAIENLRKTQKTPSRLAVLDQLTKKDRGSGRAVNPFMHETNDSSNGGIFQRENFQLQLNAPPYNVT